MPPPPATPAATRRRTGGRTGGRQSRARADGKAKPGAVEHLMTRVTGVQFEISVYKYDALFKPAEDLLEKPPAPAAKPAKPVMPVKPVKEQ